MSHYLELAFLFGAIPAAYFYTLMKLEGRRDWIFKSGLASLPIALMPFIWIFVRLSNEELRQPSAGLMYVVFAIPVIFSVSLIALGGLFILFRHTSGKLSKMRDR